MGDLNSWMVYIYNEKLYLNGWLGGTPILGNHHMANWTWKVHEHAEEPVDLGLRQGLSII